MLYDTKWQKYNYAGVYLPSFVAWLSTKPRGEYYCFCDTDNCAIAQYLKDIGHSEFRVTLTFDDECNWLTRLTASGTQNFGALHDRARALMDSAP